MKKPLFIPFVAVAAVSFLLGPAAPSAKAIKPFFDEFQAVYLKPDSTDKKDKEFAVAIEKVKCNVCHEGKSKKDRNIYGMALDLMLDKKADKDDKEKIRLALETVATIKSDPAKADAPTFGQLLAERKLPGGEPKKDVEGGAGQ